ncbi:MAG: ComF family protein [Candidatus Atribacteria bacterium]|nr:ComF family protein [Candidatus Atribacteria bacterium]
MLNRQGIGEGLLSFFFPQYCVNCKKYITESAGYPLCKECEEIIRKDVFPCCLVCGRPLHNNRQTLCRRCREKPFSFDFARAVTLYEPPIKNAIHAFKYRKILSLKILFMHLFFEYLSSNPFYRDIDGILPVPLHQSRLREREFNQAEILARGISEFLQKPLMNKVVTRKKKTLPQVGLSMKERRLNLQGAFQVEDEKFLVRKKILIIDDVLTSRSTVESLAMVLRQAGSQTILVLALATGK